VGKVYTELTITNHRDEIRADDGTIQTSQVRTITLRDVLVYTGASTLSLPQPMIARLALTPSREVDVQTAKGISRAMLYSDARLTVLGRSATFECLELPEEAVPLLGVLPLETLGLELDLQQETLLARPETGRGTHVTA
jgi:hypothetical protein